MGIFNKWKWRYLSFTSPAQSPVNTRPVGLLTWPWIWFSLAYTEPMCVACWLRIQPMRWKIPNSDLTTGNSLHGEFMLAPVWFPPQWMYKTGTTLIYTAGLLVTIMEETVPAQRQPLVDPLSLWRKLPALGDRVEGQSKECGSTVAGTLNCWTQDLVKIC